MVRNYHRFKDFAVMAAWVQAHLMTFEGPWEIESHIYEEGDCMRPGVTLYSEYETVCLRWYAFADEEGLDCIGSRLRVDARDKATDYVNRLVEAVEALEA